MFRKVSMTALAFLAISALAFAGAEQVARGWVTAVSGNTITVSGEDGRPLSFEVTEETTIVAEGAAHKAQKLRSVSKKTTVDEFVRKDQLVTLKYWEKDGTRYVEKLRVH